MGCQLIIGLGNPGKKFERTRHNIGFRVIDKLKEALGTVRERKTETAVISEYLKGDEGLVLAKPLTFMNRSGEAVKALIDCYGLPWPKHCLIISDDVALELGKLRMRERGSAGGHRGLESIIQVCGTGFNRLRVGIGRPAQAVDAGCSGGDWRGGGLPEDSDMPLEEYVLEKFSGDEEKKLVPDILKRARAAVLLWAERGAQAVMNQYN